MISIRRLTQIPADFSETKSAEICDGMKSAATGAVQR
jgi:hypothetical protein